MIEYDEMVNSENVLKKLLSLASIFIFISSFLSWLILRVLLTTLPQKNEEVPEAIPNFWELLQNFGKKSSRLRVVDTLLTQVVNK